MVESRLHVVFLSEWLAFPNGMAATNRARLLARAMVEAGAAVHVMCMQASDRPPTVENRLTRGQWHGVTFEYTCGTTTRHPSFVMRRLIELRGWAMGVARLVQMRRRGHLDCVYLWFTSQRAQPRRWLFIWLLRLLGVPVIIELNERPWPLRADQTCVERLVSPLRGVAGVVSISSCLTQWAERERRSFKRPVRVLEVPILVDMQEQPPRSLPPTQPPLVVFAGSPVYDETVEFIVRAMGRVWQTCPDCTLVITGMQPGEPASEALSARLREQGTAADDRVQLLGYLSRAELLDLYRRAAALLIPLFDDIRSRARFPTKIGEYLASGTPIVASKVGEIERLFTDGRDAFIVPAGDADAYGARIAAAVADPELAMAVGAAGLRLAADRFDYRLHGERLVGLCGQVLDDQRRRAQGDGD